jgi:hypothetical protein
MPQEISVSYQAVKSKVHKLMDAAVEGEKTHQQIVESMQRWWKLIHPADRAVAQKYLLQVLEKSHASLNAMAYVFSTDWEGNAVENERLAKTDAGNHQRGAQIV